jgi:hypothetical protein
VISANHRQPPPLFGLDDWKNTASSDGVSTVTIFGESVDG